MDISLALETVARLNSDNPPTLDELTQARDAIARELHALRGQPNVDLEALMALRDTYQVAADAVVTAETEAAEAASEVDDILAEVPDPDGAEASAAEAEGEDGEAGEEQAPEAVAASGRALSVRDAVARLGLTPTQTRARDEAPDLAATRTTVYFGNEQRDSATFGDLANAFQRAGRAARPGRERLARIETEFAADRQLPGTKDGNTRLIDSFVSPTAVAAAGGCCSLPTPIYDNPVNGSMDRPLRDSLVSMGAPRGSVEFFPAICLPQAGAAIWTCDDDAAVVEEDPETWKQCAEVECEEAETVQVDAIYACITVGNFQQRFSPEEWEGRLRALSIMQARIAEVQLWDQMRAAVSSTHLGSATGSVYVNLLNTVGLATAAIRQDQRLSEVRFNLWLPEWIKNAIRADLRARRLNTGVDSIEATEQMLAAAFANEGVDVTYSPDVDDIEAFQYDGALSPYPALASAVLAPQGYFSFLDGGTLDFGTEIRDHNLNRQNKMAAFSESFEGLLARGCNAKALDIPVEVCDSVPCPA